MINQPPEYDTSYNPEEHLYNNSRDRLILFYKKNIAEMQKKLREAMTPKRKEELQRNLKLNQEQLNKLLDPTDLGVIYVK